MCFKLAAYFRGLLKLQIDLPDTYAAIFFFDRADILRENTEAVFAACDAAHGRWAKILGVRAPIHPKLRLQEFLNIYNITQEFITATEKVKLYFSMKYKIY